MESHGALLSPESGAVSGERLGELRTGQFSDQDANRAKFTDKDIGRDPGHVVGKVPDPKPARLGVGDPPSTSSRSR